MGDKHDAWFFIGIFILIFIIWAATGGPSHPLSFTGPTLQQPTPLGGGTYLQLPQSNFSIGESSVSLKGSSGGSYGTSNLVGGTFGIPSSYRGLVSLNYSVYGAGSSNPNNEYIKLYVAQNAGVPVDISGWTISSDASNNSVTIPKGTEVPSSGTINAAQDILINPGTNVLLISGQSPIGASFKENKCIGYFSNFQKFYPNLPQNCPTPSDDLSSFYPDYIRDSACIDYVKNLPRCQIELSPPPTISGACQSFSIKYLNYNGCVDAHKNDSDFNGNTWRVYLGATKPLWRTKNELIKLRDASGKTIDAFSY